MKIVGNNNKKYGITPYEYLEARIHDGEFPWIEPCSIKTTSFRDMVKIIYLMDFHGFQCGNHEPALELADKAQKVIFHFGGRQVRDYNLEVWYK